MAAASGLQNRPGSSHGCEGECDADLWRGSEPSSPEVGLATNECFNGLIGVTEELLS